MQSFSCDLIYSSTIEGIVVCVFFDMIPGRKYSKEKHIGYFTKKYIIILKATDFRSDIMYFEGSKELISIEDILENDDYVLMKSTYKKNSFNISLLSLGFKDDSGDIVKIVDIEERYL